MVTLISALRSCWYDNKYENICSFRLWTSWNYSYLKVWNKLVSPFFILFPNANKFIKMPCLFHKDKFCHVCGQYIFIQEKKVITALVADTYSHYFGSQIKKQSAWYVPNFICQPCYVNLTQWRVGKRPRMPFKTPMVWNIPKFHPTDCYFCLVQNIPGTTSKTRSRIRYPSSSSSTRPVPYNLNEPGPIPPKFYTKLLSSSTGI